VFPGIFFFMRAVDDGKLKLPALRVRKCETSVECQSGQTLIIVGLSQKSEPPTTGKSADNAADEPALLLVLVRATFEKDSDAAKASSAAHGGNAPAPSSYYSHEATKTK
jgi:hypothetical protein